MDERLADLPAPLRTLFESFDVFAVAPSGVKKLRELILQLAVQGKLVPQDPNDEPASVLLKKIAAEKAKLVAEGKIKKSKPLPPIKSDEVPFDVPEGWEWVRLPFVMATIPPGKKKVQTKDLPQAGTYPVVDQGKILVTGYWNDPDMVIHIPHPMIVFGDHTRNIKYVDFNFVPGADGTKVLQPIRLDPRYFFFVLQGYSLEDRGYGRHFNILVQNLFPLPPLLEQHRIVARVDQLMALCDELEAKVTAQREQRQALNAAALDALLAAGDEAEFDAAWKRVCDTFDLLYDAPESVARLRQAILQLAVMGKLVKQDPSDEPASDLLKKIKAEKAKLVAEGKIKKSKPLSPIRPDDVPFEVPEGWGWAKFGEVASEIRIGPFGSTLHKSDYVRDGIPVVNPANIRDERIIPSDKMAVSRKTCDRLSVYRLEKGNVVLARRGEMGRAATVTEVENGWLCGTGSMFVQFSSKVFPRFITKVLGSTRSREYLLGSSVGSTMNNLNQKILSELPIAIPPLPEQHRIVAMVDQLMALCDELEVRLASSRERAERLVGAVVGNGAAA